MADIEIYMEEMSDLERRKWFQRQLMNWDSTENDRLMPWKGEKNPYRIWMSEIILQQTRVDQGRKYYESFISEFPDAESLADAPEEKVFKLWEGLGYYSRCRNMISAAREIQSAYGGKFPENIVDIRALPGVGPYTAAAISSFAYNQPHAVLDGNVFRVLARFFGIDEPIDQAPGRKYFASLSQSLLHTREPARYNQAIMDLGATVCKPRQPLCNTCPLNSRCRALLQNEITRLPVKIKKISRKTRWFNFLLVVKKGKVLVEKRADKDIWEDLYQFPMVESEKLPSLVSWGFEGLSLPHLDAKPSFMFQQTQQLTHQTIHGRFFVLKVEADLTKEGAFRVNGSELKKLPFPRMISRILEEMQECIG